MLSTISSLPSVGDPFSIFCRSCAVWLPCCQITTGSDLPKTLQRQWFLLTADEQYLGLGWGEVTEGGPPGLQARHSRPVCFPPGPSPLLWPSDFGSALQVQNYLVRLHTSFHSLQDSLQDNQ